MNTSYFTIVFFMLLALSCKKEKELPKVNMVDIDIERFDSLFAKSTEKTLPQLKQRYPFLFAEAIRDSVWIAKLQDTLQQQLNAAVLEKFKTSASLEAEIEQLFSYLKYYVEDFKTPRVITLTSNVDYRNKIIITDSIALIALDNYLGSEHKFYSGIHNYIRQNLTPSQIAPDLAEAYAQHFIPLPENNRFLDDMIYFGKILYFKDAVLPNTLDENKIGYNAEDIEWAKLNEYNIWQYFIEHEMLYSTNHKLTERFINTAPFSKFNLDLDQASPGRIACFIGWQIVRSYAKSTNAPFQQIMNEDTQALFNKSKYKPKKQ